MWRNVGGHKWRRSVAEICPASPVCPQQPSRTLETAVVRWNFVFVFKSIDFAFTVHDEFVENIFVLIFAYSIGSDIPLAHISSSVRISLWARLVHLMAARCTEEICCCREEVRGEAPCANSSLTLVSLPASTE